MSSPQRVVRSSPHRVARSGGAISPSDEQRATRGAVMGRRRWVRGGDVRGDEDHQGAENQDEIEVTSMTSVTTVKRRRHEDSRRHEEDRRDTSETERTEGAKCSKRIEQTRVVASAVIGYGARARSA